MYSIILASDVQQGDWPFTYIMGPVAVCPWQSPSVIFCVPCAVSAAVTCLVAGALSLSLLSTSPRVPPSLPVPSGKSTEKWGQHVCLLRLTHFLWRNILHVHQCCCEGEVSFFFMAEWSAPLTLWQTEPSSAGSSVDGRSGCCSKEHWSLDASESFRFLSRRHPQVGLPGLFTFDGPPYFFHGDDALHHTRSAHCTEASNSPCPTGWLIFLYGHARRSFLLFYFYNCNFSNQHYENVDYSSVQWGFYSLLQPSAVFIA